MQQQQVFPPNAKLNTEVTSEHGTQLKTHWQTTLMSDSHVHSALTKFWEGTERLTWHVNFDFGLFILKYFMICGLLRYLMTICHDENKNLLKSLSFIAETSFSCCLIQYYSFLWPWLKVSSQGQLQVHSWPIPMSKCGTSDFGSLEYA